MKNPKEETVSQVAIIVGDIDQACERYAAVFGIDKPEWFLTEAADQSGIRYKGQPTEARAKLAFIEFANLTLELIEPVGGPSIWRDHLDRAGDSVHHVAFNVQGMQRVVDAFAAVDVPMVQKAEYPGGRYAYLAAADKPGMDIELLENA